MTQEQKRAEKLKAEIHKPYDKLVAEMDVSVKKVSRRIDDKLQDVRGVIRAGDFEMAKLKRDLDKLGVKVKAVVDQASTLGKHAEKSVDALLKQVKAVADAERAKRRGKRSRSE